MAVPAAIATGVFTDTDHVLDFFTPSDGCLTRHMFRPFHAWEYSIIGLIVLLAVWYHPLFLAALVGYVSHLLIDQFGNRTRPLAYFLLYRFAHGFRRRSLTPHLFERHHRKFQGPVPLWGKLEPSLYRLYLRYRAGGPR